MDKPSTVSGPLIYHYCSPSSFEGIISSRELWLSNVEYANDPLEKKYFLKLIDELSFDDQNTKYQIKKEIEEIAGAFSLYSFSFLKNTDSLTGWRTYGKKGTGFAIGFVQALREKPALDLKYKDVIYDLDNQIHIIESFISKYIAKQNVAITIQEKADEMIRWNQDAVENLSIIKQNAYKDEEECRLIIQVQQQNVLRKSVRFSFSGDKFFTYIPLKFSDVFPLSSTAIEKIIIGPNNIAKESDIQIFLENNGIENVIVEKSKVYMR
jgi:hypothetical protein